MNQKNKPSDKISTQKFLENVGINSLDINRLFNVNLSKEYDSFEDFNRDFVNKYCYSTEISSEDPSKLENFIKTYHKEIYTKYFKVVDDLYDLEDSLIIKEYLYSNWVINIMFILSKGFTKNSKSDPIYEVIIKDAKVFMKNNNIRLDESNFDVSLERGNGLQSIREDTSNVYYD